MKVLSLKRQLKIGAKNAESQTLNGRKAPTLMKSNSNMKKALKIACSIIEKFFLEQVNQAEAQAYITERNLAIPESGNFNIGYAPNGNALLTHARDKGLKN